MCWYQNWLEICLRPLIGNHWQSPLLVWLSHLVLSWQFITAYPFHDFQRAFLPLDGITLVFTFLRFKCLYQRWLKSFLWCLLMCPRHSTLWAMCHYYGDYNPWMCIPEWLNICCACISVTVPAFVGLEIELIMWKCAEVLNKAIHCHLGYFTVWYMSFLVICPVNWVCL